MQNLGFDETFGEPAVLLTGYDATSNVLRRIVVDAKGSLILS